MNNLNQSDNQQPSIPKWQVYTITFIFIFGILSLVILSTGVLDEPEPKTNNEGSGLAIGHGITIELEPGLKNRISISDCKFNYARGKPFAVNCTIKNIGGNQYAPIDVYQLTYELFDEDNVSYFSNLMLSKTLHGNQAVKQEFILKEGVTRIYIYSR